MVTSGLEESVGGLGEVRKNFWRRRSGRKNAVEKIMSRDIGGRLENMRGQGEK